MYSLCSCWLFLTVMIRNISVRIAITINGCWEFNIFHRSNGTYFLLYISMTHIYHFQIFPELLNEAYFSQREFRECSKSTFNAFSSPCLPPHSPASWRRKIMQFLTLRFLLDDSGISDRSIRFTLDWMRSSVHSIRHKIFTTI